MQIEARVENESRLNKELDDATNELERNRGVSVRLVRYLATFSSLIKLNAYLVSQEAKVKNLREALRVKQEERLMPVPQMDQVDEVGSRFLPSLFRRALISTRLQDKLSVDEKPAGGRRSNSSDLSPAPTAATSLSAASAHEDAERASHTANGDTVRESLCIPCRQ
jgi:hypothetical protein